MADIKFTDVIRCSSEDPSYPASNLICHKKWLCARGNKDLSIEVEFQMDKAYVISYIDLGNHGSLSIEILVSHSMKNKEEFYSLVPTRLLMSIPESRQNINTKKVQMFKKEDMMSDVRDQTWDRMKIVCRQPHLKTNTSFGLSFFSVKKSSATTSVASPQSIEKNTMNQNKLNRFFDTMKSPKNTFPKVEKAVRNNSNLISNGEVGTTTPKIRKGSSNFTDHFKSPSMKSPRPKIFSPAAKAQFYGEVDCFLKDMNFDAMMSSTEVIKVSDLRIRIENQRGLSLSRFQKKLFMEIITDKLNAHEKKEKINENRIRQDENIEIASPRIVSRSQNNLLVQCQYCHIRLPKSVITIHTDICKTSLPPSTTNQVVTTTVFKDTTSNQTASLKAKSRNFLLFDANSDDNDDITTINDKKHEPTSWISPGTLVNNQNKKRKLDSSYTVLSDDEDIGFHIDSSNSFSTSPNTPSTSAIPSKTNGCNIQTARTLISNARTKNKAFASPLGNKNGSFIATNLNNNDIKSSLDNQHTLQAKKNSFTGSNGRPSTTNSTPYVSRPTKTVISLVDNVQKSKTAGFSVPFKKPIVQVSANDNNYNSSSSKVSYLDVQKSSSESSNSDTHQDCPICGESVSIYKIGVHASLCDGIQKAVIKQSEVRKPSKPAGIEYSECPMCGKFIDTDIIEVHVNHCIDIS